MYCIIPINKKHAYLKSVSVYYNCQSAVYKPRSIPLVAYMMYISFNIRVYIKSFDEFQQNLSVVNVSLFV